MPSASQFWCQMSNVDICSDFIKISYLGWGIDLGTWETADTLSVGTFLWFRFWWMVVPSLVPTLGSSHVTFNSIPGLGGTEGFCSFGILVLLTWRNLISLDISWHLLTRRSSTAKCSLPNCRIRPLVESAPQPTLLAMGQNCWIPWSYMKPHYQSIQSPRGNNIQDVGRHAQYDLGEIAETCLEKHWLDRFV